MSDIKRLLVLLGVLKLKKIWQNW